MAKMDELFDKLNYLRGLMDDPFLSTNEIQYTSFLSIKDLSGDSPRPKRRTLQQRDSELIPDHKTTRMKSSRDGTTLRGSHSDMIPKKKWKEEKKACLEIEDVSSSSYTEATEPLDSSTSSGDGFSELFSARPTLPESKMIPTVFGDECDPSVSMQASFKSVRFSDLAELRYLPEYSKDCLESMFYTGEELTDFRHKAFLEDCGISELFDS